MHREDLVLPSWWWPNSCPWPAGTDNRTPPPFGLTVVSQAEVVKPAAQTVLQSTDCSAERYFGLSDLVKHVP